MNAPKRTWTDVGAGVGVDRAALERVIDALAWRSTADGPVSLPLIPGEAINGVIREFKMPRVTAVAVSADLAPLGLVGVEGNYTNGRARVYAVDDGRAVTPVCSDFWPGEAVVEVEAPANGDGASHDDAPSTPTPAPVPPASSVVWPRLAPLPGAAFASQALADYAHELAQYGRTFESYRVDAGDGRLAEVLYVADERLAGVAQVGGADATWLVATSPEQAAREWARGEA